jgi:hypothetical protein
MIPTGSISSSQNSAAQALQRTKGSWRHVQVGVPSDQSWTPKKLALRSRRRRKKALQPGHA